MFDVLFFDIRGRFFVVAAQKEMIRFRKRCNKTSKK